MSQEIEHEPVFLCAVKRRLNKIETTSVLNESEVAQLSEIRCPLSSVGCCVSIHLWVCLIGLVSVHLH